MYKARRAFLPAALPAAALGGLLLVAPGSHRLHAQPAPVAAHDAAVVTRSLPAKRGVRSEAQTILDAPAEKVAGMLSDPRNFAPLFPAHAVDVLSTSSSGDAQVVAVEMRQPWPVGTVKWVEDIVTSHAEDGKAIVVSRNARPGYFKQMSARWHVAPDPAAAERCIVTYEVSMELARWVPEWMLRRGNLNGIRDTMARLRKLVAEAGRPAPQAAAPRSTSYQ
jgi:hypothetical protein